MIRFLIIIAVLLCIVEQFSCSDKYVDLVDYEDPLLRFGRGGGITGSFNEYILLEDGRVFQSFLNEDSLSFVCRARRKDAKLAFSDFALLSQEEVNAPGDVYYYISFEHLAIQKRHMWGDPSAKIDPIYYTYWNRLRSLSKTR